MTLQFARMSPSFVQAVSRLSFDTRLFLKLAGRGHQLVFVEVSTMFLRVLKTIFPVLLVGVTLVLLPEDAFARHNHGCVGCGGGGGVPEIGAGSAAAGIALIMGSATLVKDWFSRARRRITKG